jgi:hypothetical protein
MQLLQLGVSLSQPILRPTLVSLVFNIGYLILRLHVQQLCLGSMLGLLLDSD